jgi:hypothetical protein
VVALCCALTITGAAWAENPNPIASPAATQNAEASFAEAVKLFKGGDAARALPLFVHLTEKTDSPNVRLYIGYCLLELGRLRDAHQAFTLAAKEALDLEEGKYDETRVAAQEQLSVLNLRLARLTISLVQVSGEFTVKLDNETLDPSLIDSPLVVDPGAHHIQAEAPGAKPVSREITLEKGGAKTITLLFEKQTSLPAPLSPSASQHNEVRKESSDSHMVTLGLAAGGLGVIGIGTFAVAGLQTKNTYSQLQAQCASGCTDSAHRNNISEGKTMQLVANLGLAVGVAGTLTGATLLYLGVTNKESAQPELQLAPGVARVSYTGSF